MTLFIQWCKAAAASAGICSPLQFELYKGAVQTFLDCACGSISQRPKRTSCSSAPDILESAAGPPPKNTAWEAFHVGRCAVTAVLAAPGAARRSHAALSAAAASRVRWPLARACLPCP